MALTPEQRVHRARIAALTRWSSDDADLAATRRDLHVSRLADHIRRVVDSAPPLRPEDVERLRALLPAPTAEGGASDAA